MAGLSELQTSGLVAYAPASIGNVAAGFDLLGAALAPLDGSLLGDLVHHADLLADFERIELPDLTLKPAHVVLSLARTDTGVDGLVSIAANSVGTP